MSKLASLGLSNLTIIKRNMSFKKHFTKKYKSMKIKLQKLGNRNNLTLKKIIQKCLTCPSKCRKPYIVT